MVLNRYINLITFFLLGKFYKANKKMLTPPPSLPKKLNFYLYFQYLSFYRGEKNTDVNRCKQMYTIFMRNVPSNVLILFYTFFLHTYFLDINKNNLNNFLILVNLQNCRSPDKKHSIQLKKIKVCGRGHFCKSKQKKFLKRNIFCGKNLKAVATHANTSYEIHQNNLY